jgi:hypothetical protein
MLLRGAPRFNGPSHWSVDLRQGTGVGGVETDEDLICGVLQPSVRLVQLPGSLAGQLAELVTIGDMRKCSKNQIRTHKVNLLPSLSAGTPRRRRYGYWLEIESNCCPKQPVLPLDARIGHRVQKLLPKSSVRRVQAACPVSDRSDCCGELCAWQFQPPWNPKTHLATC